MLLNLKTPISWVFGESEVAGKSLNFEDGAKYDLIQVKKSVFTLKR